ncbi:DUF6456 domain-containing protein [Terrarubrum flagellatum]|uniref:DUF6456 domain-containing protein n=1 Tax=Terrirubrum flagellatum TaxID=2895980 RepID=UPI003144F19A
MVGNATTYQRDGRADRLLGLLESGPARITRANGALAGPGRGARFPADVVGTLISDDLAVRRLAAGRPRLEITAAGRARLARLRADPERAFLAQHADLREVTRGDGPVLVNEAESPLAWLHRRKGPDGEPLISAVQFAAGERLRADLERAQIMPRVTANWSASVASGRRCADPGLATEAMVEARQRVDRALIAIGPEFSGLLIDVCGFLKRLPEVERERQWPARSAKLVLEMGLSRLARHYGLAAEAKGPERSGGLRFWGADGYRPDIDGAAA